MFNRISLLSMAVIALSAAAASRLAAAQSMVNDLLIADSAEGHLQSLSVLEAGLIAIGARDEREIAAWTKRVESERTSILAAAGIGLQANRLRALHEGLHKRLLTGQYHRDATDVRRTIATGEYNCLSALALYVDLCEK